MADITVRPPLVGRQKRCPWPDCGQVRASQHSLKRHMACHTGTKSHVCKFCERTFRTKDGVREHENAVHADSARPENPRPHQCSTCNKSFARLSVLKKHVASQVCLPKIKIGITSLESSERPTSPTSMDDTASDFISVQVLPGPEISLETEVRKILDDWQEMWSSGRDDIEAQILALRERTSPVIIMAMFDDASAGLIHFAMGSSRWQFFQLLGSDFSERWCLRAFAYIAAKYITTEIHLMYQAELPEIRLAAWAWLHQRQLTDAHGRKEPGKPHINNALRMAIESEDWEIVELALERGADVDSKNSEGDGMLFLAIDRCCPLDLFRRMLLASKDPNQKDDSGGRTLSHWALRFDAGRKLFEVLGNFDIDFLARDNEEHTLLHAVCGPCRLDDDPDGLCDTMFLRLKHVRFLLAHGVDINAVDDDGRTALHTACDVNDEKMAMCLLEAGADASPLDIDGENVLHTVAERGEPGLVEAILAEQSSLAKSVSGRGTTALHIACESAHIWLEPSPLEMEVLLEIVQTLLAAGAPPNAQDSNGDTALHTLCKALSDGLGWSTRNAAVEADFVELFLKILRTLSKDGADWLIANDNERTPLDLLRQLALDGVDHRSTCTGFGAAKTHIADDCSHCVDARLAVAIANELGVTSIP